VVYHEAEIKTTLALEGPHTGRSLKMLCRQRSAIATVQSLLAVSVE
jgi:hypothetical protein